MRRFAILGLRLLAVQLALLYGADWALLHLRMARGSAYGTVQVHQMLATPLKGQKEEYDYLGDAAMRCSRSIFPYGWPPGEHPPCWWLARHTTVWE